jgi:hypothetical protein
MTDTDPVPTGEKQIDRFDAIGGLVAASMAAAVMAVDANSWTVPSLTFVAGVFLCPYLIHTIRGGLDVE